MIKAVIFDVDGTLVDSVDLHARAWQEAFDRFGKKIPFEQVRSQIGKGGDQLMPVFFSKQELEEFGEEMEKFRGDLFKREYLPRVKAFPDVRELFERVRREGQRIALASSAKEDELKTYKKIARIEDLVEEETSADDAEKSKPHPDIFEAALAQLGDVKPFGGRRRRRHALRRRGGWQGRTLDRRFPLRRLPRRRLARGGLRPNLPGRLRPPRALRRLAPRVEVNVRRLAQLVKIHPREDSPRQLGAPLRRRRKAHR